MLTAYQPPIRNAWGLSRRFELHLARIGTEAIYGTVFYLMPPSGAPMISMRPIIPNALLISDTLMPGSTSVSLHSVDSLPTAVEPFLASSATAGAPPDDHRLVPAAPIRYANDSMPGVSPAFLSMTTDCAERPRTEYESTEKVTLIPAEPTQPSIVDLNHDLLLRIVRQLPAAIPSASVLAEAKTLSELRLVSRAFRDAVDDALQGKTELQGEEGLHNRTLAAIARSHAAETIAHLAQSEAAIEDFRDAVSVLLKKARHVAVDFNRVSCPDQRGAILDALKEKDDLYSLEVKSYPEYATEVIDVMLFLQRQSDQLAHLGLDFNSRECKVKLSQTDVCKLGGLTALTWLDLSHNLIGDTGIEALAGLPVLNRLYLAWNNIGSAGAASLAQLRSLVWLDASYNDIDNTGAAALAALPMLHSLNLFWNDIDALGIAALSKSTTLSFLDASFNEIGSGGAAELAKMPCLQTLNLKGTYLGADGAIELAKSPSLTSLDASSNNVGDQGAEALAQVITLLSLKLSDNNIGDAGAGALAKLPEMRYLDLSHNNIKYAGAVELANMKNLKWLSVMLNEIGSRGYNLLINSLPETTVIN